MRRRRGPEMKSGYANSKQGTNRRRRDKGQIAKTRNIVRTISIGIVGKKEKHEKN